MRNDQYRRTVKRHPAIIRKAYDKAQTLRADKLTMRNGQYCWRRTVKTFCHPQKHTGQAPDTYKLIRRICQQAFGKFSFENWILYAQEAEICGQRRSRSACAFVQSNLSIFCSSTYTTVATNFVSGQLRPRSACAYADQGLPCPRITYFRALCIIYKQKKQLIHII